MKKILLTAFIFTSLYGNTLANDFNGCWKSIEAKTKMMVGMTIQITDTQIIDNDTLECSFSTKGNKYIGDCALILDGLKVLEGKYFMEIVDGKLLMDYPNAVGGFSSLKAEKIDCDKEKK